VAVELERISADLADVVAAARRSLVSIRNGRRGAGAGSIWHPDGLILTNAHVVERRSITVTLPDGRAMPARVVAREPAFDLAALSVEAEGLPAIELGDSREIRSGELVIALGHPWGVEGAAAAGVVIGIGPGPVDHPMPGNEWIVAGLMLRPGNSGGPLIDARGRLVGINTMMTGPEVAMAVPVHVAKDFLQRSLTEHHYGRQGRAA
jgi:serine protease Do